MCACCGQQVALLFNQMPCVLCEGEVAQINNIQRKERPQRETEEKEEIRVGGGGTSDEPLSGEMTRLQTARL